MRPLVDWTTVNHAKVAKAIQISTGIFAGVVTASIIVLDQYTKKMATDIAELRKDIAEMPRKQAELMNSLPFIKN